MKKQIKTKWVKVVCFCMAMIMVIGLLTPLKSYAADTDPFIITGEYDGNYSLTTDEESLFRISEAAPGNFYRGKITVKNTGPDKMDIAIVDIASNISDQSLYEKLELTISRSGIVLYSGSYGNTPDPVTNFITVAPWDSTYFDIEVHFPEYSNNDFQGKVLDSTWTFEGQYHNKERIQTGHELDSTNPMDSLFPMIVIGAAVVISISVILIIYLKKKENREQE